jgi:uncharacterized protein with von Willebrand factor type A (vWA) domain
MRRTTCPSNYIPPSDEEIRADCKEHKIKRSAPDFVRDICQVMAGGSLRPLTEISEDVTREVENYGFPQRQGDVGNVTYRSVKTGLTAATPRDVMDLDIDKYVKFHTKTSGMIQQVQGMMDDVPGTCPKEKAINLLKLIQKQNESKGKCNKGKGGGGQGDGTSSSEEMDALGDMEDYMDTKEKIEEVLDQVNNLNDQELDMMAGQSDDPEDINNPARKQQSKANKRMKVAENMQQSDKTILEVARKLNEFSKLRSKTEIKFNKDLEGETIVYRPMEDITELGRIRPSAWSVYAKAPNLFKYQALTGNIRVRERGNFTHYKQLLYMIIDCSGSMGGERYWKAGGVLMNRLKAVVKGDAQLIWRLFDDKAYEEHYAKTVADAYTGLDFMRNGKNFGGGGTNFDVALKSAAKSIRDNIAKHGFIKPEIMIVTDGDGHTDMTKKTLDNCVVHAVCVTESVNHSLVRLTKETGGIYTHC